MEAAQMSIKGWIDKQNVDAYNGILLNLKKEGNSDTHYNMGEYWGHYAKWNKPVTKDEYCMILLTWGI